MAWRRDLDPVRHANLLTSVEAVMVQMAEPVMPYSEIAPGSFLVAGNTMFIHREALAGMFRVLAQAFSQSDVLEALGGLDEEGRISPSHKGARTLAAIAGPSATLTRPWDY